MTRIFMYHPTNNIMMNNSYHEELYHHAVTARNLFTAIAKIQDTHVRNDLHYLTTNCLVEITKKFGCYEEKGVMGPKTVQMFQDLGIDTKYLTNWIAYSHELKQDYNITDHTQDIDEYQAVQQFERCVSSLHGDVQTALITQKLVIAMYR